MMGRGPDGAGGRSVEGRGKKGVGERAKDPEGQPGGRGKRNRGRED